MSRGRRRRHHAGARAPGEATAAPAVEVRAHDAHDGGTDAAPPEHGPSVEPVSEPAPAARRRWRFRLPAPVAIGLLGIAAFATGLVLFDVAVMPQFIHSGPQVHVPDLANLTLEQAERTLRGAGLRLTRSGERFDPSVPRGFVLSQEPPADTPVRGGRLVSVVVSLGEEFSSVPELFGQSRRGAELLVQSAGLRVGGVTLAPSDAVGPGLVGGTDPPAETVLPHNTPVSLLISSGADDESYVMPDLLGRDARATRRQLETDGFRVVTAVEMPTNGVVLSQVPAPGERIALGATIRLQAVGFQRP